MVNPQELRIGNILSYGSNVDPKENIFVVVETIGKDGINHKATYDEDYLDAEPFIDFYKYEHLNPIPLTPEILEQCGFEKSGDFNDKLYFTKQGFDNLKDYGNQQIVIENGESYLECGYYQNIIDCNCLHQLQNLYLALTGKELEIREL